MNRTSSTHMLPPVFRGSQFPDIKNNETRFREKTGIFILLTLNLANSMNRVGLFKCFRIVPNIQMPYEFLNTIIQLDLNQSFFI